MKDGCKTERIEDRDMNCQLTRLSEMKSQNSFLEEILQNRIKNIWNIKKRLKYYSLKTCSIVDPKKKDAKKNISVQTSIREKDWVRVKSKGEIAQIVDYKDSSGGCVFAPEMYSFCGKTYRVYKIVNSFYDEVKEKECKCRNIFLLDGAFCSGKRKALPHDCDRNCFYFWHHSWLEKIDKPITT
jgi:hypothetical protein